VLSYRGEFRWVHLEHKKALIYERQLLDKPESKLIIILNNSNEQVRIDLPEGIQDKSYNALIKEEVINLEKQILIEAYDYYVLKGAENEA
jgi:hypothetical protein